ncbi:MAG: hypothetical protein U0931_15035 [Vulcanimicrobiota bacterium]
MKTTGKPDFSAALKQLSELRSELNAMQQRQAAKPLDQSELFLQLKTGQNPRPWAPLAQPIVQQMGQDELFSQLAQQAAHPDQAAPRPRASLAQDRPCVAPGPATATSQEVLLEMLQEEAKRHV